MFDAIRVVIKAIVLSHKRVIYIAYIGLLMTRTDRSVGRSAESMYVMVAACSRKSL